MDKKKLFFRLTYVKMVLIEFTEGAEMKIDEISNLLHGGDYNPDQWLDYPEILEDDIELMKEAGVNVVTLGVFAWSSLEPEEGVFTFEWLDNIMDRLYENGIYVILSTPSAARPPWLAKKYPEIMRGSMMDGRRMIFGGRENHCESSEIWREKVRIIDEKLAERYANHPALIMWHLSNEMHGLCYCENCAVNFRKWLRNKYGTVDKLNKQYWTAFWSRGFTDFDEINPPTRFGEGQLHGQVIDYMRFYTDLYIDFLEMEKKAVTKYNPDIPVTTNMFMQHHTVKINYHKMAKSLDVASYDSYPKWHLGPDKTTEWKTAVWASMRFDFMRALKGKPFYIMESVPSVPNHFEYCKLKRPKMHMLSSILALSSGSDSIQYFQWRKSLGAIEKFHGAVVDHDGSGDTRVFRDVREVGEKLKEVSYLKGQKNKADVAFVFDWENMIALFEQQNLRKDKELFDKIQREHYEAILKNYVNIDVIGVDNDFSGYKVIAAPMLYMFKEGVGDKIRQFVENGGSFVLTYYSGIVNENDLCFHGTRRNPAFAPHGLNDVFGLRVNEIDALCDDEHNEISFGDKTFKAINFCELTENLGAKPLAKYRHDFYAELDAATEHEYGGGKAYYLACNADDDFLYEFYKHVIDNAEIDRIADGGYVKDVMVKERAGRKFIMNFSTEKRRISVRGKMIELAGYEYAII